ncbi:MAG TPA: penicillin-binding protein 2 [Candidatus Marinimicrobia bacterium]|nr:penicillin-binding protein 2 [Candidatus Neomarinimicrobiota bacterium]
MFYVKNNVTSLHRNLLIATVFALFIVLGFRLYQLQIVEYSRFAGIAEANQIRVVTKEAPRGLIYDRNGQIIVENKSQYNLNIIPYETVKNDSVFRLLSRITGISESEIRQRVQKNYRGLFLPARVATDIDFKMLTEIEERRLELPGVLYSLESVRSFPGPANLSHVLGYLREIDKEDLRMIKDYGYHAGDLIGWNGVEREYENILHGQKGFEYVQVNVFGQEVGKVQDERSVKPRFGNDLYLTVDIGLQDYTEKLLAGKKGAAIVMDAESGEILAMTSKPDYSPELFSGIVESGVWSRLLNDADRPLYNRAMQGTYPAGSTFKIVAVFASLQNSILNPDALIRCQGVYRLGRREFKCWKTGGHGRMNLFDAIVNSCNVYFYNLIRKMDLDLWADYARKFHFGAFTNVDLYGESQGVVPDEAFLNKKYGLGGWTEGNKLNLVIGQGDLLVTPLQMVRFAGTLATHGKVVTPHFGLRYLDCQTNRFQTFVFTNPDSVSGISAAHWDFVEKAMYDVVNSKNGTGRAARVRDLDVYGKTGTAQNPHGEDHSWFIGYSKRDSQILAVTVLIEHGGSGGGEAAVAAGRILNYCKKNLVPTPAQTEIATR